MIFCQNYFICDVFQFLSGYIFFLNIFLKASLEIQFFNPHAIASSTALSRLPVSLKRFINRSHFDKTPDNLFVGYMSNKFNYTLKLFLDFSLIFQSIFFSLSQVGAPAILISKLLKSFYFKISAISTKKMDIFNGPMNSANTYYFES